MLSHADTMSGAPDESTATPPLSDSEERPFSEGEVSEMLEAAEALAENNELLYSDVDARQELQELLEELRDPHSERDVQERGRVLLDLLEWLESGGEELGAEGGEEGLAEGAPPGQQLRRVAAAGEELAGEQPPYLGEQALAELWVEVGELCNEADLPALEDELDGLPPEEQWGSLLAVRRYLLDGEAEEQRSFELWQPSGEELLAVWSDLLVKVSAEDAAEMRTLWEKADGDERRALAWDVRRYVADLEEEEEAMAAERRGAEEWSQGGGVRRRGGGAAGGVAAACGEEEDAKGYAKRGLRGGLLGDSGAKQRRRSWLVAAVGLSLAAAAAGLLAAAAGWLSLP